MRTSSALLVTALLATAGVAHADRRATAVAVLTDDARIKPRVSTGEMRLTGPVERHVRLPAQLEAADVSAQVAAYREDIERCYLSRVGDVAKAGQLDVLFEIGRDGRVRSVATAAPGLTPYSAPAVTKCIKRIARGVEFPTRRNDTTVLVPYLFQKTVTRESGPQLSCWSAKGCH